MSDQPLAAVALRPPYYVDETVTLYHGDCLAILPDLAECSIDAIVTDPPYSLGFMGKSWDRTGVANDVGMWREVLRVLKPGGHLLAFGGTRTAHRLICAIEDAGFEIRDSIAWLYASGFPKSLDVSKAIDRAAGAARPVLDTIPDRWAGKGSVLQRSMQTEADTVDITIPATDDARRWQGWGTALKPAHEPIIVARKPLDGTVAANVLTHGTGALNIDGCRVASDEDTARRPAEVRDTSAPFGRGVEMGGNGSPLGRWPANVALDENAAAELDKQAGVSQSRAGIPRRGANGDGWGMTATGAEYDDVGGPSRFFPTFLIDDAPPLRYEPKAPTTERPRDGVTAHPTVKPLDLMRWLVRLVTPSNGLVLDPFAGSGTTAEACIVEGFRCIAIEQETTYLPLIVARVSKPLQPVLADFEVPSGYTGTGSR